MPCYFLPPRGAVPTWNLAGRGGAGITKAANLRGFLFLWQPGAALSTGFVEDCGTPGSPGARAGLQEGRGPGPRAG